VNPYVQEHTDMMNSILGKGPYINEAMAVAESTLTCIQNLPPGGNVMGLYQERALARQ